MEGLTILGNKVEGWITADKLESFPAPNVGKVKFVTHEVTSFCPVTNQPDLYTVEIEYTPFELCVESKSLKLYLGSFRNEGIFGEGLAAKIADDFFEMIKPCWVEVTTIQQIRGGLRMTAGSERHSEERQDKKLEMVSKVSK